MVRVSLQREMPIGKSYTQKSGLCYVEVSKGKGRRSVKSEVDRSERSCMLQSSQSRPERLPHRDGGWGSMACSHSDEQFTHRFAFSANLIHSCCVQYAVHMRYVGRSRRSHYQTADPVHLPFYLRLDLVPISPTLRKLINLLRSKNPVIAIRISNDRCNLLCMIGVNQVDLRELSQCSKVLG
jgi:hypothetical protein